MNLKQILNNALHEAMRTNNELRKRTIRLVLASMKHAEVASGNPQDDTEIYAIIQKEIKARNEAIEDAKKANRPDLISDSEMEIKILEEFLPSQLSEAELRDLAQQVILELSASSSKDMGRVIKEVISRTQGRASGSMVSHAVRSQLEKI